jgi:hypothetical protein
MGLQPVITTVNTGKVVFQRIDATVQGGFALDATGLLATGTISAGQPMGYDEATRIAKVSKCAEVNANAANNAVAIQVKKGHMFQVGDYVAKTVGGAAYAITAIDTSNAAYDTLTIGTTLGVALTAGDVLFCSSATGAAAAAIAVTPKGLLKGDIDVAADAGITIVLEGVVYERRVPKAGPVLSPFMQNIIYSQSF